MTSECSNTARRHTSVSRNASGAGTPEQGRVAPQAQISAAYWGAGLIVGVALHLHGPITADRRGSAGVLVVVIVGSLAVV